MADTDTAAPEPSSPSRRRLLLYVLAGALVLAGIAVAIWALLPGTDPAPTSSTPSTTASSTPTSTPSASASTTPSPVPPASGTQEPTAPDAGALPRIDAFTVASETVICPDDRGSEVPLSFAWHAEDGDHAWIGVATNDASVQPFAEVPLDSSDYADISYRCADEEQLFTLTVRGPGGMVSSSLSVTRILE